MNQEPQKNSRQTTLLFTFSLLAFALALGAPRPARADRAVTRGGKEIEGIFADSAAGKLRMWLGPAQITLPLAQVASLTTDTLAVNTLIDARYRLEGRLYEEGASKLGLAAQQGAPTDRIAALVNAHGDALAEAIPQLSLGAREGLSAALAALAASPGAPGQAPDYALTARRLYLHLALGESDKANALLAALGPNYFTQHPAEAARFAAMLEKMLEAWSQAEDFPSGQSVMQLLQRIAPRRAAGAAIQFYLQWGSVERRDGRYESALRLYARYLVPLAPQIAQDRIAKTLEEAERTIRQRQHPMEAAPLYETFGLPTIPVIARQRLARIWHDEGWARLWESKIPEARQAFAQAVKYNKDCADHCAAKDIAQCDWRERRAKLAPEDYKGHYELGKWCEEKELLNEALIEYRGALQSPKLFAEADAQIQTIESKLAEARLSAIQTLYEKGDYGAVLQQIQLFMHQEHPAGYLAQARQIEENTREALKMRVAQRPAQAESLYKQAEQAFYEEDYPRAQALLDTVTTHYGDTMIISKANALAALVSQKLEVAALEAGQKPKPKPKPQQGKGSITTTSGTLPRPSIVAGTRSTIKNASDSLITSGGVSNAPVTIPPPPPAPAAKPGAKAPADSGQASPALPGSIESQTLTNALQKIVNEEGLPNNGK